MVDRVAQDRNLTEDYMINKAEKEEKHRAAITCHGVS